MKPIHDIEVDDLLHDAVFIEPLALEEEFARVAADFAYFAQKSSDAYETEQLAELHQKRTKARLYLEHRLRLEEEASENAAVAVPETDAKGKPKAVKVERVTEAQVDSAVVNDPEMVAADVAMITATVARDRSKLTLEAIRTKREMLVSLGAHARAEMAGDPAIRSYHANAKRTKLASDG